MKTSCQKAKTSTPSNTISRSDRPPETSKPRSPKTKTEIQPGIGASSSGMTSEERARSQLLPTTGETENAVPRERAPEADQAEKESAGIYTVPSTT